MEIITSLPMCHVTRECPLVMGMVIVKIKRNRKLMKFLEVTYSIYILVKYLALKITLFFGRCKFRSHDASATIIASYANANA